MSGQFFLPSNANANEFYSKCKLHVVYSVRVKGLLIKQYCNIMSGLIFVLSDQNGDLVGHMSFQEKQIICSPVTQLWIVSHGQNYQKEMAIG